MTESAIEVASKRGFVLGVAWAVAIVHQYGSDADQLLNESGLRLVDFIDAGVEEKI